MHDLVPMVLFVSLFGMIFGIFYIRSRENMAMLEKGLNPRTPRPAQRITPRPFISLKFGLLITGAGLGALTAYMMDIFVISHRIYLGTDGFRHQDYMDATPLYPILIGVGGGLGLIISYIIEKRFWDRNKDL